MSRHRDSSTRTGLEALGAVIVTVVVFAGALVGAVLLGVQLLGSGSTSGASEAPPSLYIPPRTSASPADGASSSAADPASGDSGSSPQPKADDQQQKKSGSKARGFTLDASPRSASAYDTITLSGSYDAANGTTLSVQRQEGGWSDFADVTAEVQDGRYTTTIETGVAGSQRFRMLDADAGRASDSVIIEIH